MFSLFLYPRPAAGTTYMRDLTALAGATWTRTTRALGGYWTGEFTLSGISRDELWAFYHDNIARVVKEVSLGRVTWEGEIYEMTINVDGAAYRTTLDPDQWHNKVKTQYTYPRITDTEQGNLTYTATTFQDDGQDFSPYETLAGDAVYRIDCYNDDATGADGFIGGVNTVTNPDDTLNIFRDRARTNAGWNGAYSGKTCLTYTVSHVDNAGSAQETAWAETTDSSNIYGESCFVDVRGEMQQADAEGLRDRRLTEHAYPRSVPAGGLSSDGGESGGASIDVLVAGYAYSMNRRFMASDVIQANASTQIGVLVDGTADAAEFVTAGTIDANSGVTPTIMCSELPMRLWDLCEEITEMGDGSGARWVAGVYAGRLLNYNAAETTVTHYWRNGRLYDLAGVAMYPTMIEPGIIVQVESVPFGVTPGSGNVFDSPQTFFVEEVEFVAPRSYRLIPYEGDALEGSY